MNADLQLDMRSHNETIQLRQKLVMLGASNLSRAFPVAISMSRNVFDAPLSIYVAKGHGRSYGQESSCFGKKISGIFSCGIWRAIEREKNVPITAVVTDIGNDLAYEVPVETVLEWVEGCIDRLLSFNARVVVSDLPLEVLKELGATRYRCFRAILFPQCRLSWDEMLSRAEQLSKRLRELAKQKDIPVFTVRKQWYGLDPIHPLAKHYPEIWSQLLALATDRQPQLLDGRCSLRLRWYLRRLQPESWSNFSIARHAKQPCGRLSDGSTISLY